MSNSLAISAVTLTLRHLIDTALQEAVPATTPAEVKPSGSIQVTTLPLDKARDKDANGNQVNLFLYLTALNAAWRNQDLPRQARPGEISSPPLALDLYYLITAYAENNNELTSEFLLARAMRAMHDNALLMPVDLSSALAASELHDQIERVRTTPQPLSLEEMSKLWMTFQTPYRLSVAYQVSVVLIETSRRKRTALPVRAPNLYLSTFRRPILESVDPQVVLPGDALTIAGQNLDIDALKVKFGTVLEDPTSAAPLKLVATVPAAVRAGVNTVQVVQELLLGTPPVAHPGAGFASNVAAFVVAPKITTAGPITVAAGANLSLSVAPPVGREQRVELFVGDQSIPLPARDVNAPATTSNLTFLIPAGATPGSYLLRVQVDGANSPLDVDTNPASATFNQYIGPTVTIT